MNRVILIGNTARDAERRGQTVVFTLATSTGKNSPADFHTVKCFQKTADMVEGTKKGAKLAVEGRLVYNTYQKDGERRMFAEILADRVEFLSPRDPNAEKPKADNDSELPF